MVKAKKGEEKIKDSKPIIKLKPNASKLLEIISSPESIETEIQKKEKEVKKLESKKEQEKAEEEEVQEQSRQTIFRPSSISRASSLEPVEAPVRNLEQDMRNITPEKKGENENPLVEYTKSNRIGIDYERNTKKEQTYETMLRVKEPEKREITEVGRERATVRAHNVQFSQPREWAEVETEREYDVINPSGKFDKERTNIIDSEQERMGLKTRREYWNR